MLFYSFFKTMVGKEVAVELKNDLALTGKLHSVSEAHLPARSQSPPPRLRHHTTTQHSHDFPCARRI